MVGGPPAGDGSPQLRDPRGPSRRTLLLLVTPIVVLVAVGRVGDALGPTLLAKHALLFITFEARNRNLILASTKVSFAPFLVVGVIRRLAADPLFYALGLLYGDRAVRWMEREVGDGSRRIERWFRRAAYPLVFLAPGLPVCVLAGATKMPPVLFAALNILGTITIVAALWLLGRAFPGPVNTVNRFISRNYKWLTVVTIALTLVWLVDRRRRGRTMSVEDVEQAIEPDETGGPDRPIAN